MFERIKKAFAKGTPAPVQPPPALPDAAAFGPVSQWASSQGFAFSTQGGGFAMDGPVAGKPARIEVGRPSRKYIQGEELRGRAELGISSDVLVVLMNRPLKESLEKQAYALYTDTLQTSVDPNLPEEMRLLAMYEEVGWDSMPRIFWTRYSIVADDREHAMAWVDPGLVKRLLEWPAPAPAADLPFMLMLLRGKAYLRMQQGAGHMPTLQHAAQVFSAACENALGAFPPGA
jgi:hypothetical protein